ncbi:MAG: hypothetical protein JEZ04_06775 [Spirochaetales bacterium]|nr:hypothetical protein [Spirochaetales bacterium]
MIFLPITVLILYLLVDFLLTGMYRRKIRIVIHVNGSRGKSTVVRMLDEVFRNCGYKTCAKVSGTLPRFIDVDGKENHIRRVFPNIREQRKFLKRAARDKAEVFIAECMAISPELQRVSEQFLTADIAVITNVRSDHLEGMGRTRNEIARTLLESVRQNQRIVTGDEFLYSRYREDYTRMSLAKGFDQLENEFAQNTDIVFEVARLLSLEQARVTSSLSSYRKDPGCSKIVKYRENYIHMGFSANDLESTEELYLRYKGNGEGILWFNDRSDRPLRSRIFLGWMLKRVPDKIILSGERIVQNRRFLQKKGFDGEIVHKDWLESSECHVFGIGNVRGLEYLLGDNHV